VPECLTWNLGKVVGWGILGPSWTVRSGLAGECIAVIVRLCARQNSWYGSGGLETLAVRRQRLCTRQLAERACIEVRKMRSITLCRFLRLRFLDLQRTQPSGTERPRELLRDLHLWWLDAHSTCRSLLLLQTASDVIRAG